tara:strand:+ start:1562 stop:2071 length:510 start_codon:yes stop_codon:yes gene_type:complete
MRDISNNIINLETLEIVNTDIDNSNNLILMYTRNNDTVNLNCCTGYRCCQNIDKYSYETSSSIGNSTSESNTDSLISDDDSSSNYTPSDSEEPEDELTEEMLFDFLPIDRQNKLLGIEYYINNAGMSFDPLFMPLYEHLANTQDPVPVRDDWERQKNNFSFIGGSVYDA